MKTAKISLESIKDEGWMDLCYDLFFDKFKLENPDLNDDEIHDMVHDKCNEKFEYGEYRSITIEVDENFNIVGGKID